MGNVFYLLNFRIKIIHSLLIELIVRLVVSVMNVLDWVVEWAKLGVV